MWVGADCHCEQRSDVAISCPHPLVLSLSKDGCRWFDKLTMSGGRRTLKRPLMRKRSSLTPPAVVGYDESVVNLAQACDYYVGI